MESPIASVPELDPTVPPDEVVVFPPGDLDSDEPPLESSLHLQQMVLLLKCLDWWWRDRTDYFAAGNLSIYYSPQLRPAAVRGPDFFVVLGTERRPRKSWVVWQEDGKYPNVIIELPSSSTAASDRGRKKEIYQDIFRTPEYFWFDPNGTEFQGFGLMRGVYQPLQPNAAGHLWSEQLQLFLGVHAGQLRFFTPDGDLVPTPEEDALQAENRAATAEALLARYQAQFGDLPEPPASD